VEGVRLDSDTCFVVAEPPPCLGIKQIGEPPELRGSRLSCEAGELSILVVLNQGTILSLADVHVVGTVQSVLYDYAGCDSVLPNSPLSSNA